jgi:hypothetical protein
MTKLAWVTDRWVMAFSLRLGLCGLAFHGFGEDLAEAVEAVLPGCPALADPLLHGS